MSDIFEQTNEVKNAISVNSILTAIHEDAKLLHEVALILETDEQKLKQFLVNNILVNPSHSSKKKTSVEKSDKSENVVSKQVKHSTKVVMHTDGGSRGNPGVAGCGVDIAYDNGVAKGYYFYLGTKTNNEAEYSGLVNGLKLMLEQGVTEIEAFADSELMCNQINGKYKVNNENLLLYYKEAKDLISKFKSFSLTHVLRGKNKNADMLANMAMDKKVNGEIELTVVG